MFILALISLGLLSTSSSGSFLFHAGRRQHAEFDVDQRIRSQWKELTAICPQRDFVSCRSVDNATWTDVRHTRIGKLAFKGLGTYSTFKIETFDTRGRRRTRGGDSWYLLLRDYQQRLRLSVRIFDEGDGTYTGVVHFLHAGNYTLWGWLWYRLVFSS